MWAQLHVLSAFVKLNLQIILNVLFILVREKLRDSSDVTKSWVGENKSWLKPEIEPENRGVT